jgi:hypothetical protein
MLYGASMTYAPFALLSTNKYRDQVRANRHHLKVSNDQQLLPRAEPFLPYAHEKMYVTLVSPVGVLKLGILSKLDYG